MDRKSIIIIAASIAVLFIFPKVVDHYFPEKPILITTAVTRTNLPAETNFASARPASASVAPVARTANPSRAEQTLTVTNEDLIWHFTSLGGGIKEVELREYPAAIFPPSRRPAHPTLASLNRDALTAVLSLQGGELEPDAEYTLTRTDGKVRAEKTFGNGLRVVKEFYLGTNYLFNARLTFENTGSQPVSVPAREVTIGTATAIGPLDDPTAMGTFWYNGVKTENVKDTWFANRTLGCIPGVPRQEYEGGANNVGWAAVHNQFFTLATMPSNPAPRIVIRKVTVPAPEVIGLTNTLSAVLTNGYEAALSYPAAALPKNPVKPMIASTLLFIR